VLHRHRLLWDRPDTFDPRRFLGNAAATVDRFAYLPFGAGPRKCIGCTFAMAPRARRSDAEWDIRPDAAVIQTSY